MVLRACPTASQARPKEIQPPVLPSIHSPVRPAIRTAPERQRPDCEDGGPEQHEARTEQLGSEEVDRTPHQRDALREPDQHVRHTSGIDEHEVRKPGEVAGARHD